MEIINLGTFIANNYIYAVKDYYVVIDTGYEKEFLRFKKKLQKNRISIDTIKYVFLTHAHDDHAGFLNELLNNTDSKVILSAQAKDGLYRGQNSFEGGCSSIQALLFCKFMALVGKGDHRFPKIEKKFEKRLIICEEHKKKFFQEELQGTIIETPGHTKCSISLLLNDGKLFCGDAAMNGFPSKNKVTIWVENSEEFCQSWEKIIQINPTIIFPGHGRCFMVSELGTYLVKARKIKQYTLVNPIV